MWTALQIIFVFLGLLLAYGGNRLGLPILFYAGIICLGFGILVMGWEAIVTRRLVLRRRGRVRQAYSGFPAVLQGIQFNVVGLSLIGLALVMYFNNGQQIFQHWIRRPALLLVLLGALCLLQAMIMFWGYGKPREESRAGMVLGILIGRLFPGLIWLVIGVGLIALGLFEAVAPVMFDEIGGILLEELYGVR